MAHEHSSAARRPLTEALVVYAAFCGLSLASRSVPSLFVLVVVSGMAFPLIWGRVTRRWAAMGFTRQRLGQSLAWGLGAGLLGMLYIVWTAPSDPRPEATQLAVQLAVGIPLAILFVSPFQEFLFRGWLQPRLEAFLGRWAGLLATAAAFSLWHVLPPFEGSPTSTVEVTSASGMLTTLAMGLLFGYILQRTRNIAGAWLAHVLWLVATMWIGALTFVQVTP